MQPERQQHIVRTGALIRSCVLADEEGTSTAVIWSSSSSSSSNCGNGVRDSGHASLDASLDAAAQAGGAGRAAALPRHDAAPAAEAPGPLSR